MQKKWFLPVILGLALIPVAPGFTGCGSPAAAQDVTPQIQISQQAQGIWVSGSGEVAAIPDIALLRLGIVSQEETVAASQAKASDAMTRVMKALADSGVAQKDIQTGSFSINQRTMWDEKTQTEIITGYQVTNMVTVKIRDTGKVGATIDSVVQAGQNLIRISDIGFSVEDPANYYQQAREKAMANARKKAEQLATLAGVTLGKPTYVVEGDQSSVIYNRGIMNMGAAGMIALPAPSELPPISAGETRITLNVQVAYSISQ